MAIRNPVAELADAIAARVTETVPRTTSYRESITAAAARAITESDPAALRAVAAAVAKSGSEPLDAS